MRVSSAVSMKRSTVHHHAAKGVRSMRETMMTPRAREAQNGR
jgi:hypothetical protein